MSEDEALAAKRDRLMNERARLVLDGVDPAELAMPAQECGAAEYVAIQEIPWGATRAFHVGETVPTSTVQELGWLDLGLVAERAQPRVYLLKPGDRLLIQPRHPITVRVLTAPLYGIPVHIDEQLADGAWQLRENDVVVASGDLAPGHRHAVYVPGLGLVAFQEPPDEGDQE